MDVRLRVLVVDDNKDAADSLAWIVTDCGHEVKVAYDGAAVLEAVDTFRPHIVLLDIGMPGINGFELAKVLRQDDGLAGVLIIAITGFSDDAHRKMAQDAGFNFFLVKPVDTGMLRDFLMMPHAGLPNRPTPVSRPKP